MTWLGRVAAALAGFLVGLGGFWFVKLTDFPHRLAVRPRHG
jgi:hypothetical protein